MSTFLSIHQHISLQLGPILGFYHYLGKSSIVVGAVVVAQLVERSLPVPYLRASNPVICKKLFPVNCIEKTKIKEKEARNGPFFKTSLIVPPKSWSSLDKEESLACQITSPFNKKMGAFCMATFLIYFKKQLSLLLNGEVIWQSSDSSSSKELHSQIKCPLSLWPDVIFLVNNWATLLFEHPVTLALVYLMVSKVNSLMMISVLSFANF